MSNKSLRIISRESPLAMWQAKFVRTELERYFPGINVEIIGTTTKADQFLNKRLSEMGGKGAFVKELEQALLNNEADLAVHSMKDVPIDLPQGLKISAIMARESEGDSLVSVKYSSLEDVPANGIIGTSSLRRCSQIKHHRNDLVINDIRGNVGTRLKKLDEGEFDALILATAGLRRLGLADRITQQIGKDILLPAVGQGALGIETREGDQGITEIVEALEHQPTRICLEAERAVSKRLNGGCHAPVGAYATLENDQVIIEAMVGQLDGKSIIRQSIQGQQSEHVNLGTMLADQLLQAGADSILENLTGI